MKKQLFGLIVILILFILSALVVLPIDKGVLLGKKVQLGLDLQGGVHLVYQANLSGVAAADQDSVLNGVIDVVNNRVNPLGVSEPSISRQGTDRIVLELPGATLTDEQKQRIGSTALLEFGELAASGEAYTWQNALGNWKPATDTGKPDGKILDSSYFKGNTHLATDPTTNQVLLVFDWNDDGAKISEAVTSRLAPTHGRLGIFEGDTSLLGDDGLPVAPQVIAVITTTGEITGLSATEAQLLSRQLNAGRLPVPLTLVYENTVSSVLGADFVHLAVLAGAIGIILVMFFMTAFYRLPGVVSALVLLFYSTLVLAIYKILGVVLTLAGIGGFILSLGMAVDANVLIFERLKDELRGKRSVGAAIEAGFSRAWTAIWDSHVTTFIACGILYWVGSSIAAGGPVKGFALTLAVGVAVNIFTAYLVTRTLLRSLIGSNLAKNEALFTTESRDAHA